MIEIKRYEWDEIPNVSDDAESPEMARLINAKSALMAGYCAVEGEEGLADLLADLRHLCDALGLDFGEEDDRARRHYLEELQEESK